jgi:hypothetical protein
MNKLDILNKSEEALHEVDAIAYQKCFKAVLNHFKEEDITVIHPEKVREFMDNHLDYYKHFISALITKYNEKLEECESWKDMANKLQTRKK